jgi:protein-S-isoprenylcysteine O-methyltransferase Ste14
MSVCVSIYIYIYMCVCMSVSIGACIALTGMVVRIAAMHTNKVGFTHIIQETRRSDHELCTWGIYKYANSPSG